MWSESESFGVNGISTWQGQCSDRMRRELELKSRAQRGGSSLLRVPAFTYLLALTPDRMEAGTGQAR